MHGWFACKGFASRTEQTSPTHSQLYYICVNIYVTFAGASTVSTVSAAAWEGERGTRPHYVPTLPQNTQFGACSENFLISLELHSLNGSVAGWLGGQAGRVGVCSQSHNAQLFFAQFIRITILFGRPLSLNSWLLAGRKGGKVREGVPG